MITSLEKGKLISYLARQLQNMFPDETAKDLRSVVPTALERLEHCFSRVKLAGYHNKGNVYFNHLHSDQFATFLYFASNVAANAGNIPLASKLFCLNKALNGVVCMYDTVMPDIFLLVHSVGVMIGKAHYSNYLVVFQNVTVGADRGIYPRFGEGVVIFGGSAVIGRCEIGSNVSISTQSLVLNSSIPAEHIVAGRSPNQIIKPAKRVLIEEFFDTERSNIL